MCTRRTRRWIVRLITLLTLTFLSSTNRAEESVFRKPVPEGAADLRAIEERMTAVVDRVVPCTVALQVGAAHASGVVVSADGYVLTAAHVIERPGRGVRVIFPDGSTAKGKTLGVNPRVDGGMVKITDEGPWPFAPIAPRDEVPHPGDWCIALGHPGGFQPGRTPPVRLGRIIETDRAIIRTDCTISMGDSGGPLFDMQGRVIGIHSRIADETTMNLHVPAATYQEAWDALTAGEIKTQPSRFLTRLDTNGDGRITRAEVPEGYRAVFDRMARKFDLDPAKTYSIDELSKSMGLESSQAFDGRLLLPMRFVRPGDSLSPERFAHGRSMRSAFETLMGDTCHSVVRVKCDGDDVAFGTIVRADGYIVTKASEVSKPDQIVCVLDDHRELAAQVVRSDSVYDLALLRVDATGLKPVQFQSMALRPGMWLASPGQSTRPVAIGVVSNMERRVTGSPGVLGVLIDDVEGGAVVMQVMPGSGAAVAGIRAGDVITRAGTEPVRSSGQLQAAVRKHRVGDAVSTMVERDGTTLEFSIRLGSRDDSFIDARAMGRRGDDTSNGSTWRGPVSQRRDDFPVAIQHDSVLRPRDCGGPVVDSAGHVIGINIARADRTATYALPGSAVLALLDKVKGAETTSAVRQSERRRTSQ